MGDRITRILLVDADAALRRSLAEHLSAQPGWQVVEAGDGGEALLRAAAQPFQAALVDAHLPDQDGAALCRSLRRQGMPGGLILLLPAGAADPGPDPDGAQAHLVKPIRLGMLLSRLGELLRPAPASDDGPVLTIGPYRFDPSAKRLEAGDGTRVRLTEKESRILAHLYRSDAPVPRQALLDAVWGYGAGIQTHTLETHIYRLRRKIEADPTRATLLVTEAGGYRLVP